METKEWYFSKELWAFLISVVARLLQDFTGYEVLTPAVQAELTGFIIVMIRLFFTAKPTTLNVMVLKKNGDSTA